MTRRSGAAIWSALTAAELEAALRRELAHARELVAPRLLRAAGDDADVLQQLKSALGEAAFAALEAEIGSRIVRCPTCEVAFVRRDRPKSAPCVHCGARLALPDPADSTASSLHDSSAETRIVGEPGACAPERGESGPARAGDSVGPYTVERLLGRGGMGFVYLASDALGVEVALKLARPSLPVDQLRRFRREGEIAARLDHPSIVRHRARGESDRVGPWLALELVIGTPLTALVQTRPSLDRSLAIAAAIAHAMDHAHRRGIVHRDLKPGNVLLDREGRVKVLDFGLARDLDAATVLTSPTALIGTPGSMAPEQAERRNDLVGVATDVHGIGLILHELVTGARPVDPGVTSEDSERPGGRAPLAPPSSKRPELGLTPDFDAVVARALAPRPGDRYLTAQELANDLEALRRSERPHHAFEVAASDDPSLALSPGDLFGNYQVRYLIGRGGSAVVWKARAKDGSPVALKILRQPDDEARARFDREVRLLALLSREEPGFVSLMDHGVTPLGPWLAMPFVAGGTLRDRLERGPLPVESALAVLRTVAATVGRAHARGITHRDLKPENILLTAEGEPLVSDLGIARHSRRDLSGASASATVSREGRFLGTAGYVSPEQLEDPHHAGPTADVFALGAILYECLAGKPAFREDTLVQLAVTLATARHAPLDEVRPDAPSWLVRVVERALAPDPRRRYLDAAELVVALQPETDAKKGSETSPLAKLRRLLPGGREKPPRAPDPASPGD